MVMPTIFSNAGGNQLVNYDYVDIANGLGIIQLYGTAIGISGSAIYYNLTNQANYSQQIETLVSAGGSQTLNFDMSPFNTPRILKGTAYLSVPLWGNSPNNLVKVTARIQKSSKGVVTNCSSQLGSYGQFTGAGGHNMEFMALDLTTTNFKRGDFLRVEIIFSNASAQDAVIGHDPAGRFGTYITSALTAPTMTTKLQAYLPFKIDL